MRLLGIDVDTLSQRELVARCEAWLTGAGFHRIVTVNPEFLVRTQTDQAFRVAVEQADLRIADGFGLVLAGWLHGKHIKRFPGADLMEALLHMVDEKKLSVFLAVRKDGLSSYEEIKSILSKQYPNINIGGANLESSNWKEESELPVTSYQLLLCNFGAPEQELFLESLRCTSGDVRLAMGVGGSFDYLTGKLQRAPHLFSRMGLEWAWRFLLQPGRWKRILRAVIVFPILVIREKITKKRRPLRRKGRLY